MTLMELKGIKKYFHAKPAVNGVDLAVREGEAITLFGPNGAGKSTLIKILSGIMSPGEGEILFNGDSVNGAGIQKHIFFLGHKNSLYNSLTVSENMVFVNRLFSRNNGSKQIETVLKEHGLWNRRNDPVKELSQGLKRRAAIARGFIVSPKLLVLDEPFAGLDLKWRRSVVNKIKELKEGGKSLILATHLIEEGYELADRIAFLHKGSFLFVKDKSETNITEIKDIFHSFGEAA
jgi:ABC-type multidrug transport system ATPase subunit